MSSTSSSSSVNGNYDSETYDQSDPELRMGRLAPSSHLKPWVKRRSYQGETFHFYPPDPALPASTQPIYTTWDGHQLSEWSFECSINDASYPLYLFRRPGSDHFDLIARVEAFDIPGLPAFDIPGLPGNHSSSSSSIFDLDIKVSAIHSQSGFSTSLHDGSILRSSDVKEILSGDGDVYDEDRVTIHDDDPTLIIGFDDDYPTFVIAYASFSTDHGLFVSFSYARDNLWPMLNIHDFHLFLHRKAFIAITSGSCKRRVGTYEKLDSEGTRRQDSKDFLSSVIPEILAQIVGFAGPRVITDISTISKGLRENLLSLRGSSFLRSCIDDRHHQSFLVDEGVRQFLGLSSPWKEGAFRADKWAFRCLVGLNSPYEIKLRGFEGGKLVSVGEVPHEVKDMYREDVEKGWAKCYHQCEYDRVELLLEGLSPTGHVVTLYKGIMYDSTELQLARTDILQMELTLNGKRNESPPDPYKESGEEWAPFDTIEFQFMKSNDYFNKVAGDEKYVSDMLSKLALEQYCKGVK